MFLFKKICEIGILTTALLGGVFTIGLNGAKLYEMDRKDSDKDDSEKTENTNDEEKEA